MKTDVSFELDENTDGPLYQRVQSVILRHIEDGSLSPGSRLPSFVELSKEMGIAYATVARGVRALVLEGVLDASTSQGTLVADLNSRRARHIGIFGNITYSLMVTRTRYYRSLLFLIQEALAERRQAAVYNHWTKRDDLLTLMNKVHSVDGAVLFHVLDHQLEQVKQALDNGTSLICVGDTFEDSSIPSVHTTTRSDMLRLVQLLRRRGHERIALLDLSGQKPDFVLEQKIGGFKQGMSDLAPETQPIICATPEDAAYELKETKCAPTAIILVNQVEQFRNFANLLKSTRLELGKHMMVAAWDENLWHHVEPLDIGFIGVEQPLQQIADIAVNSLMRMMDEPDYNPGLIQVASQIVESTAEGQRTIC